VAMPLGLATNAGDLEPWQRLASLGVGLGVSTGALWWLARSPATQVQLDLTCHRLRLVHFGLLGRTMRQFSFDDLASAEVEQGTDSDGGRVWRPLVRLRTASWSSCRSCGATIKPVWKRVWPSWRRRANSLTLPGRRLRKTPVSDPVRPSIPC